MEKKSTKTRRQNLKQHLQEQMKRLENEYGFDYANGYSQVAGKGEETNRAYGKYDFIRYLLTGTTYF